MAKVPYTKPAITYTEQLVKLKRRGLVIDDEPAFLELLEKKSYYRLSGYWYPLLDDKTFSSWLHGLVYVRNVCAHHSRLWNRVMRIQPVIPKNPKNDWLRNRSIPNNKIYYVLSMIIYLLTSINEKNSVISDFNALLYKYSNVHTGAMGFPSNWKTEALWQV